MRLMRLKFGARGATTSRPEARGGGGYLPALDGLRAVAVLAVMAFHAGMPFARGGFLGVDVFFVLSGFLITTLLLTEHDRLGRIRLRNFYARRGLRLFPALAVLLAAAAVYAATVAPPIYRASTFARIPYVLFYVANWAQVLDWRVAAYPKGILGHTWSLAVEEQFYMLWPAILLLILAVFKRRDRIAGGLLLASLAVALYRALLWHHGLPSLRLLYGSDTRCDGLLLGCALSFLLTGREPVPGVRHARLLRRASVIAVLVLAVLGTSFAATNPMFFEGGITIAVVATGLLMWSLVVAPVNLFRVLLESPLMVYIGRRSYGLYLWHFPIYLALPLPGWPRILAVLIRIALTFAVAAASYRWVETPFLRLKRHWSRISSPGLPPTAGSDSADAVDAPAQGRGGTGVVTRAVARGD